MRDVMDPLKSFEILVNNWWKMVVIAVVGGLIGLAISFMLPPKYEAEAIFHASIDFTQINYENMVGEYGDPLVWTQFEEDLALQVVKRIMTSQLGPTFLYAQTVDPSIELETFKVDQKIERYLGEWTIRYRHPDPKIAQEIVNFWADKGYEALLVAKDTGKMESFVIVDLVSKADLPFAPIYRNRGTLILAGTMIGLLIGIIWIDFSHRYLHPRMKED